VDVPSSQSMHARVRLDGEWVGVHELLRLDDLGIQPPVLGSFQLRTEAERQYRENVLARHREMRAERLASFRAEVASLATG